MFRNNKDCLEFIQRLSTGLLKKEILCYAWVLMSNHVHLLLSPTRETISNLLGSVLTSYAIYFNRRYQRSGYLYQNRYKSILCQKEKYLYELIRYIHLNPLRAGIVKNMEELNQYRWSGHRYLVENIKIKWQDKVEVLRRFGRTRKEAIREYQNFVYAGVKEGNKSELEGGGLKRSAGSWQEIKKMKKEKDYWISDERILGEGEFVEKALSIGEEAISKQVKLKKQGWDLEQLASKICQEMGVEERKIRQRCRQPKDVCAKRLFAYYAYKELGVKRQLIAEYLGVSGSAVSQAVNQGEKEERKIVLLTD